MACLWAAFIVLIVVPWGRFEDHPHWENVAWIPFVSPPVRVRDILLNALLYVPLGGALAAGLRARRVAWTFALALALTTGTEYTQLYSHRRWPSMTDVAANAVGALLGAGIVRALRRPGQVA